MTPEQLNEARAVAGKLTEAQRRRILEMTPHDRNYAGYRDGSSYASVVKAGLACKCSPVRGGWRYYSLTQLGLAVRTILQEHPNG